MTTITLGSPGDLLTCLPYQLGYHPRRSLVVVAMADRRIAAIARAAVDVDGPGLRPEQLADAAAGVVGPLVLASVDGAFLVGYDDVPGRTDALAAAVRARCDEQGLRVCAHLRVHQGRYWVGDPDAVGRAGGPGGGGEPSELTWSGPGEPMPDPSRVPAVADFVALGAAPATDRDALGDLVACDGSVRSQEVGQALARLAPVRPDGRAGRRVGGAKRATTDLEAARAAWRAVLGEPTGGPDGRLAEGELLAEEVTRAVAALLDVGWRDALLAWLCPGSLPSHALPENLRGGLFGIPRLAARRRGPRGRPRVTTGASVREEVHARRVIARLHALARAVPDSAGDAAAAVLTVDAHVLWWHGDGAMSSVALDRALRISPDYTLARLLVRMVGFGVRPGGAA